MSQFSGKLMAYLCVVHTGKVVLSYGNEWLLTFSFGQVVVGGGQEAMSVTTTSTRIGKFDARFFHLVFEEEFGSVKGHFGPINSLSFHPDGKRLVSKA